MKNPDRMKTVLINGVPYRMRGDMKLPWWRSGAALNCPFRKGHLDYLTTPTSCEKKREKEGDGCEYRKPYYAGSPVKEITEIVKPFMVTRQLYGAPCLVRGDMHLPNYWRSSGAKGTWRSTAAKLDSAGVKRLKQNDQWVLP